jgi:hypothetical protein
MSTTVSPHVYTVREAAQLVGVSEWLAGQEIRRTGTIAGVQVIRVGKRVLIPRDALDRVLAGCAPREDARHVAA